MKSKILCALLALCLLVSLLPMTVSAANPDITVTFFNKGNKSDRDNKTPGVYIQLTIKPGDPAKYITTNAEGKMTEWTDTANAPTDNFVKLDYPADGAAKLKVTLKNVYINGQGTSDAYQAPAMDFGAGDYAIDMELVGVNKILDGCSAGIKYQASKGMTITGAGSLDINLNGSAAGALWVAGGDLLIKNTTMNFSVLQNNHSLHHAIFAATGSVAIEGSKITSVTDGGSFVYLGTTDDIAGGDGNGRFTLTSDTNRTIKVKDSEIDVKINQNRNAFNSASSAVISNTTLKITLGTSNGPIFSPAPTFEGEYTAIAGLAKNAEKLDKLKYYDAKKISSYTYFYMIPGIVELLPTEPEPEVTVPDTTTPDPIVPDTTEPDATTPDATTPDASTPDATTPSASTPDASTPSASTPSTTQPSGDTNSNTSTNTDKTDDTNKADTADKKDDGKKDDNEKNPMKVILIVLAALLVVACGAFGVIFYLKKKKA